MKLTVRNVSAQDSGEYSCEVVGGATTKAKLEIKGEAKYSAFTYFYLTALNHCILDSVPMTTLKLW